MFPFLITKKNLFIYVFVDFFLEEPLDYQVAFSNPIKSYKKMYWRLINRSGVLIKAQI